MLYLSKSYSCLIWSNTPRRTRTAARARSRSGWRHSYCYFKCNFLPFVYAFRKNDAKEASEKSGFYKTNYKEYQKRIRLALEQLLKSGANADNIVVIGYCFGGTGALEAVRSNMNIKAGVSFHGGLGKDNNRFNNLLQPKVLVLHGADDKFVSQTDIEAFQKEMRDGNADWQMIYYANAVHAFTEKSVGKDKSKGVAYNEKADKRSWQHLLLFLQEVLQ